MPEEEPSSNADRDPGILDVLRAPEVLAAVLGTFVIMLGFGLVSPVLPSYARSFDVGRDAVGLLISGFAAMRLLSGPFVGQLIDRRGERAMVALGAGIVGVTSIAAGLAPTFPLLLLFRSLGGLGSALFFAALLSYLLRTIPSHRSGRVMSVWYGAFNIGIIAGAPIGGLIAGSLGPASVLHVYGAACFLSGWVFWVRIRNPGRGPDETRKGGIRRLPWGRPFAAALASNGAYLWVTGAVFSTLIPLFGQEEVGMSLGGIGAALAVLTAFELVFLFPAGTATDRRGRRAVLIPSLAAFAAVVALFGFATTPALFLGGMALFGFAGAFVGVPPAPMLSDITPEDMKGTAVAVFRFVGDVGFVLGPLLAGWTSEHLGFPAAFAISAVPLVVAFVLVLSIAETRSPVPRTGEAVGL